VNSDPGDAQPRRPLRVRLWRMVRWFLLSGPGFLGYLLVNPYRTSLIRLALSQDWLIRDLYNSQCGPLCPPLTAAGVETWRLPLQQPGFAGLAVYQLQHGIPSMTTAEFAALRALPVPKRVIYGASDPQMSPSDMTATAARDQKSLCRR
jgi:hypothetical protein